MLTRLKRLGVAALATVAMAAPASAATVVDFSTGLAGVGALLEAVFCMRRSSCALIFSTRASALWLRSQAFSSASHSTPLCSAKPESSEAMTARFRVVEIRS